MSKINTQSNQANMNNSNKGTAGTNKQNSQVHGNRSKQIQQSTNKKTGK
ncbi:MAG: hypothetical protein ACI9SP_000253 [Arenicella sp.]|jgi:hypothetical protein